MARTISDAHEKACHSVCLPQPSACAHLDSAAYDVFLSMATDGVVGLLS